MANTAVRYASWERRRGASLAAPFGGSFPGVSFIPELPEARLSFEAAFGADLTTDSAFWSWTPITTDVRAESGISCRLGRADESSTTNPAELSAVLTNTSGDYSRGGRSRRYPYIRPNTPVRLRVDTGTGARTLWLGFASEWQPGWESLTGDAEVAVVKLSASGTLRRLAQGAAPVVSPIRRYLTNEPDVVAYWPCEEGDDADNFPAAVGTRDMTWTGDVDLASCDDYPGSNPLPTSNGVAGVGGSFRTTVDGYTPASDYSTGVRMLMSLPPAASAPANNSVLMRVWLYGGSVGRFEVCYQTAGVFNVIAYATSGAILSSANATFSVDGVPGLISLEFYQSGGTFFYNLNFLRNDRTSYGSIPGNPSGTGTLGIVSEIWIDPSAAVTGMGFGHIAVLKARSATDPLTDVYQQVHGYPNELITSGRVTRLCSENGIEFTLYGGTSDTATPSDYAGSQGIDDVLTLLRECEKQERGVLWDGLRAGLAYTTRRRRENAPAALTIDAAAGELAPPFQPTDDDQRIRNKWSVTRKSGATYVSEDADGPMGTGEIGVYDDSLTINSYADQAAQELAGWLVHAGTVEGYRYPSLTIDLRATPQHAEAVVDLFPGARVDVTNLDDALTGSAPETVSLTVEGISHDIGPRHWRVTLNCSPFEVWRVGVLASDTGDTNELTARLDTDTATVDTTALAGATSLSVATSSPSGLVWTTDSDDYPLYLNVGGVQVRATACAGASSPQTFTVDALPVDRPAGAAVSVWNPPVIGL